MEQQSATFQVPNGTLTFDVTGNGPVLVYLPGWPFNRQTYRNLIPHLSKHYTCINIDTLGLGESTWNAQTDFSIPSQAQAIVQLLQHLNVKAFRILAFNSAGVVARYIAAEKTDAVQQLLLMNTDIPGQRPPWLPLYRFVFSLPGGRHLLNNPIAKHFVLPSPLMLGLAFEDLQQIDPDFYRLILRPMLTDSRCFKGLGLYMKGFSYELMDRFTVPGGVHEKIKAPTHLIWGENDPTFPRSHARSMTKTLPAFKSLDVIPGARLLVHEEKPEAVLERLQSRLAEIPHSDRQNSTDTAAA